MTKKFLSVLILSLFITSGSAFAADIDLGEGYHVPSGFSSILITSSDGTAIQNAVDNIQSGGTISLSGDFKLKKDNINIKKTLTIKGIGNAILDRSGASEKDRVIRCQGNITLENLTLIGGDSLNGGGIKIDGGKVKIISCDIHGNTSLWGGGGIYALIGTLELTGCNISNNASLFPGGGLNALGSSVTMNNCKITGNSTSSKCGGGVAVTGSSRVTATSCDISGNIVKPKTDADLASADVYCEDSATYTAN